MVENHICVKCTKQEVCKVSDIIDKFDNIKKPLGVDIEMKECQYFDEVDKDNTTDED